MLKHIVWSRLSSETENVATEALWFVVDAYEPARAALMKVLRGLVPDLPGLVFETQATVDAARPDMTGRDADRAHVFIENKFWAGLTDQQPMGYLEALRDGGTDRAILLFVAPAERVPSLWRELDQRLEVARVGRETLHVPPGIEYAVRTSLGPVLAISAWHQVLGAIQLELASDPTGIADLDQLRAVCAISDREAFRPLTSEYVTDQEWPAFLLRMGDLTRTVVDLGVERGVLDVKGLMPSSTWQRIGRYASLVRSNAGVWVGVDLTAWRDHGATPLWLAFSTTDWGRGNAFRDEIRLWAKERGAPFASWGGSGFAVGLRLPLGAERGAVAASVVHQIEQMDAVAAVAQAG